MGILDIIFGLVILGVILLVLKEFKLPTSFYRRKDTRRVQSYIDQREKLMVDQLGDSKDDDDDKNNEKQVKK